MTIPDRHRMREGGNGLPPADADKDGKVWLFTCVDCGRRWADPFGIPAECCRYDLDEVDGIMSEGLVVHKIPADEYRRIRLHGDPRPKGGAPTDE